MTEVSHFADDASYVAQTPDQVVDYAYDYQNRLVGKVLDADGDGTIDSSSRYVYDGNQIVLQFDKSGTGSASASDLSHRYLWGPAVDQLLADEHVGSLQTPGGVVWPLTDQLGTVRDLATYNSQNDVTTIANHRVYDAYGNLTSQTSAVDCVFGFTGKLHDSDTGLQNNLNRWYDASVGRWMSEDPSGFDAGDGNLNRYVGNSPITATDPSGLCPDRFGSVGSFFGTLGAGFVGIGKALTYPFRLIPGTGDFWATRDAALQDLYDRSNIGGTGWQTMSEYGSEGAAIALTAGLATEAEASGAIRGVADGRITGYTTHGLNQAIGREGVGVSNRAILDAVRNSQRVVEQGGGVTKYIGKNATVITNSEGRIITTYPRGSGGFRIPR